MFKVESVWRLETNMLIVKVIGTVRTNNLMFIDKQLETKMINKMVMTILTAEKYNGKVLDTVPNMPKDKDKIVVCSSIIFNTYDNLEAFKTACHQILSQE